MEAPRTHYQVSFTARQALSLFVGLLAALAVAYFFGLLTGLSGTEPEQAVASPPASEEAPVAAAGSADHAAFPIPVTAAPAASVAPAAPGSSVQVFEDGEGGGPPRPTARAAAVSAPSPRAPSAGGFRVQVISVSSRAEADAEARKLSRSGFSARVEPGSGAKGPIFRVRVGPFATREEAVKATQRLAAEGRRDAWIVPPSQ